MSKAWVAGLDRNPPVPTAQALARPAVVGARPDHPVHIRNSDQPRRQSIALRPRVTSRPRRASARFSLQAGGLRVRIKPAPVRQMEAMTHNAIGIELAAV